MANEVLPSEDAAVTADVRPPRRGDAGGLARLAALVAKEFLQLRRDPRTLALMIFMPVLLMTMFGYAASFDVKHVATELVGNDSTVVRRVLGASDAFAVRDAIAPDDGAARADIQHDRVLVAIVVDRSGQPTNVLIDGSRLLEAMTVERNLAALTASAGVRAPVHVDVLYNPSLTSAPYMVPGLIGQIMVQVGVVLTALGIVRERERGTIEQLMITPISRLELMLGKVVPYLVVALVDVVGIVAVAWLLFGVVLSGSLALLMLASVLFLAATLGIGLLISTVAQNQQQALQISVFFQLPQVLLSGWVFPLASIPWGVRWLSYLFPLTYFLPAARGLYLKGSGFGDIRGELAVLVVMAVVYIGLAVARFRKSLD